MSELTAHEILVRARNRVDLEGWCGHSAIFGPWCLGNAITTGLHGAGVWRQPLGVFAEKAGLSRYCQPREVFAWNDAPGRTKAEVLAAFDKAISATAPAPVDPLEGVDVREVVAS